MSVHAHIAWVRNSQRKVDVDYSPFPNLLQDLSWRWHRLRYGLQPRGVVIASASESDI